MFPKPIPIGPLHLSYYGIAVALGVLAALVLFSKTAPRRGLSAAVARDLCFWMVLAGLIGSRVFYVIFHWPEFKNYFLDVFAYWRGGLMFQGGVVAALVVSPVFLKRYGLKFWPTADVLAPSLAIGQSLGRLGCFSAGCCYGQPTEGWSDQIGVVFPQGSLAPAGLSLYPTQLLEAAGLLALCVLLVFLLNSKRAFWNVNGRVAALYLTGAGLLRFTVEQFRGDYRGDALLFGWPPTTLTAAVAVLAGLALFFGLRRKTT